MLDESVVRRIRDSRRVCVFTGAGVSAESGIPTFRDSDGLWENYKVEDLVTPEAFARDPVAVWRWHIWLQNLCHGAKPNAAHETIAAMDALYPEFLLITQNIDDLHERAGTKRMVKLHGDIMETLCLDSGHVMRITEPFEPDEALSRASLPKCPECGGHCRPNVVWFGEELPLEPFYQGREFAADCDLLFIVGTSGVVGGGYGFTELAKWNRALIIEINPVRSALSRLADISIRQPAAEAFSQIFH